VQQFLGTSNGNEQNTRAWLRGFEQIVSSNSLEILNIMDWIPTVFVTFKLVVLITGMFFAIKWHYDREIKAGKEKRAVLRMGGKVVVLFVLSLLSLGLVTFALIRMLDM
jgi:hypothetical protein